jgi:outer membrane protein assembly factor BamB
VSRADSVEQPPDGVNCAITNNNSDTPVNDNDVTDHVILVSTLDGGLFALDKKTGAVRWKLADEPAVKSPYDPGKPVLPAFLPDPKDGALYMMGASLQAASLCALRSERFFRIWPFRRTGSGSGSPYDLKYQSNQLNV